VETGQKQITVFTIGHSTHTLKEFIEILLVQKIEKVVDIRTIPRSRHNPQFNKDTLPKELGAIGYVHMAELGGLRHTKPDSPNTGWKNNSFRGFADYMLTEVFEKSIEELIATAQKEEIVIMCAEAVPWRCHRSLIADALTVRGVEVIHIFSKFSIKPHQLTLFAKTEGTKITYPAAETKQKELW
jgi:uncharacterized protein (DUF488 family)